MKRWINHPGHQEQEHADSCGVAHAPVLPANGITGAPGPKAAEQRRESHDAQEHTGHACFRSEPEPVILRMVRGTVKIGSGPRHGKDGLEVAQPHAEPGRMPNHFHSVGKDLQPGLAGESLC
jgi:hypothetical protein